jgi:plastocyanin
MKLVAPLLLAAALGCSGDGAVNPLGAGGVGGGGAGTGGSGGTGPDPSFLPFEPCTTPSAYVTGATSIAFGGARGNIYDPPCLQVAAGTTVTFSGDLGNHPLAPSAARGTLTGNPITVTSAGFTASFTFPDAGFWAYYCMVHGSDFDGQDMAGVVWVK